MADLTQSVLEHIKCSHAALDTAKATLDKQAAEKQAAEALIPSVVDALVKFERIAPEDREKAAAALRDPQRVMQVLLNTADPNQNVRPTPLGTPGGSTKQASANHNNSYPGRRTSNESPADQKFREKIVGSR